MVQFIQLPESPEGRLYRSLGESLSQGLMRRQEQQKIQQQLQNQREQQGILSKKLFGNDEFSKLTPEQQMSIANYKQKQAEQGFKQRSQLRKESLLNRLLGPEMASNILQSEEGDQTLDLPERSLEQQTSQQNDLSDDQILALGLIDPQAAKLVQSAQQEKRKHYEAERSYHAGFTKDIEKELDKSREIIPMKESSLNLSREAIESGKVGRFTIDALANILPFSIGDKLRTAKGAQLIQAGKENLLNNMSRVSSRAQNMWFEQRLSSMFPKIGQSEEANLTMQEMLEGEVAADKKRVDILTRMMDEDEKKYGYVRKDILRRADREINEEHKKIFKRTSYRLKEIEDREEGLSGLKRKVGKNVSKGTPMTLGMMKLYYEKFGDKALETAKKNGYTIPTFEEFQEYQKTPIEFREEPSENTKKNRR